MIIAIDGPAGSGKSTVAKLLAQELNIEYIDSGAIYRTFTLYGMQNFNEKCAGHEEQIAEAAKNNAELISISYENHTQIMWLEGEKVAEKLRQPELTAQVKYIANCPQCRELVNDKIRSISRSYAVVIDGRDIGTIVFPDTPYKFYLDAKPMVRAKRRAIDLNIPQEGEGFENLLNSINLRDKTDMEREIAPLKAADDAVCIDTSDLSIEQVMSVLLDHFERIRQNQKVF